MQDKDSSKPCSCTEQKILPAPLVCLKQIYPVLQVEFSLYYFHRNIRSCEQKFNLFWGPLTPVWRMPCLSSTQDNKQQVPEDILSLPRLRHSRQSFFCLCPLSISSWTASSHIPMQHQLATGAAAAVRARGKAPPRNSLASYIQGKTKLFGEDGL